MAFKMRTGTASEFGNGSNMSEGEIVNVKSGLTTENGGAMFYAPRDGVPERVITDVDQTIQSDINFTGTISKGGTPLTPTAAEINRLSGVTDNIQSQINALNQSLTWSNIVTLSATPVNCTGTISGSVSMRYTQNHKYVVVWGRIRIKNFARTGGNPGVTLSLPFTYDLSYPVGYRGESPVEQVNLIFASGRLTTTESYSNATGSTLTLMVPVTIVPLI